MPKLKISIKRSPVKVLWIDTSRIWNLDISTWKKIAKLIIEEKLVVVDTGQLAEMMERYSNGAIPMNEDSKAKLEVYRTIATGYIAIDHSSFQSRQTQIAMESYVENSDDVEYAFADLFDDLIQGLTPMFDKLNETALEKIGTPRAFKTLSSDIVDDWKALRKISRAKKQSRQDRQTEEILGMHGALVSAMTGSNQARKRHLVGHYLRKWERASGNTDFSKMLDFFRSEYYQSISYVNIYSWIISDLITGEEELRPSDYFDAIMIPMILPFADFMLIDRSMKNRLINKLKLIKPSGIYDCKLITLSELDGVLGSM